MDSSTAPAAPETRSGFIPRRHGADTAGQRKLTAGLRWSIRGDAEPAPERWQAIGEALMHGDPAADALVEWMQAQGMGKAWPLLQRALADFLRGEACPWQARLDWCLVAQPARHVVRAVVVAVGPRPELREEAAGNGAEHEHPERGDGVLLAQVDDAADGHDDHGQGDAVVRPVSKRDNSQCQQPIQSNASAQADQQSRALTSATS